MDTVNKIEANKLSILDLTLNFSNDILERCESPIEQYLMSNILLYLFRSKFSTDIGFTNPEDHNWNLSNFGRLYLTYDDPLNLTTELEKIQLEKVGYQQHSLGYAKTLGLYFQDDGSLGIFHKNKIRKTTFRIYPQLEIDTSTKYRLDFGIFCDHFIDGLPERTVKIAVECDGYEFHSTPESLLKDNRRSRELALIDWTMYRYSGREIHQMTTLRLIDNFFREIRLLASKR